MLTVLLEQTEDLGARHALDLGDTVRVTQDHTDLLPDRYADTPSQ